METKSIWKSKTLWFNLLATVILGISNFVAENQLIPNEWAVLVVTVVNFVLRFLTTKPVTP